MRHKLGKSFLAIIYFSSRLLIMNYNKKIRAMQSITAITILKESVGIPIATKQDCFSYLQLHCHKTCVCKIYSQEERDESRYMHVYRHIYEYIFSIFVLHTYICTYSVYLVHRHSYPYTQYIWATDVHAHIPCLFGLQKYMLIYQVYLGRRHNYTLKPRFFLCISNNYYTLLSQI